MNKKNNNNSGSNSAKSRKIEKNKEDIAIKQGSPLLESQNSALIKILNRINSKKLK